ncbi:DUF4256 domain-containing protein [Altibacter sp.]|uniref:DUF4256 domain-containing protein n=1 Tax=Altibacter sp. TaxID=2024823 RepID=UPI0025898A7E|nr:DUF4256 domain-containing protein [Altibacter sp.]MCW9038658.1 DUF4256 domain-containing protein [Altibacter sp.]
MKKISKEQTEILLSTLEKRFSKNPQRHQGLVWSNVQSKLASLPTALWSLHEMERTGGEPDVVDYTSETDTYVFFDCSKESPKERRSLCYDQEALESRKKFKPSGNAVDMAATMGIELLGEDQYLYLQTLGDYDTKTSSWIKTPENMRALGGALFGDRRFGRVFFYHNGAESYYAGRGFRGWISL